MEGTTEAQHFDRRAFKVKRIYASLAPDERSANLNLSVDEQEFKVLLAPEAFRPIDNAWGRKGWTRVELASLAEPELRAALAMAWAHGK